ncbi:MAG: hypothetical protein AVO39_11485 [delta proteobacterium MLS_D]|jgi:hypothetical protein|nr:MAG: hypothetical protein AVO39_11485 [delta proteobacterium MLS_D]
MRIIVTVCLMVSFAAFSGSAWAEPQMNPGKWEITTTTEMAGIPPQSATHIQCITRDDLVPVSEDAQQECEVNDIKIEGDTVSWKIACQGEGGGMEGTGQVTYRGDSMNGTMNMTIKPYGSNVKNTFSGRRIGKCDGTETATPVTSTSDSSAGDVLADDARDVGKAAKDETKNSVIDEVREGVRGTIRGLFK